MNYEPLNTAVLVLAFNRPNMTARIFDQIRKARPSRLYVAVDGPRSGNRQDVALCGEVRKIVSAVDWPCALTTLFRDQNLGCKRGVSEAIDWFFTCEEEGIILEDDCLPSLSFFRFCEILLPRFKSDDRIFAIQGNFFGTDTIPDTSYLFSKHFYMWGWATWAGRWGSVNIYDFDTEKVGRAVREDKWLGPGRLEQIYWLEILDRQAVGDIDSWGYSVAFHCFGNKLFNVTPTKNLVLNIGVDDDATRTADMDWGPFHREALEIEVPLADCERYRGATDLQRFENRWRIQISSWRLLKRILKNKFPRTQEFARTVKNAVARKSHTR